MPDETIIITGASSGIGKATKELLEDRYEIINLSRSTNFDLSNLNNLDWMEKLKEKNICGLINNAALCIKKPIIELSVEEINKTINLNLITPLLLSRAVKNTLEKNHGSIVNVTSIHAVATIPKNGIYAATKAGLEALTRSMAIEFAPEIRVNAVRPGSTMTPMLPYKKDMEKDIPVQRIAEPEEIAKVIAFLLSEDASFINGEIITVDGGTLAKLSVTK